MPRPGMNNLGFGSHSLEGSHKEVSDETSSLHIVIVERNRPSTGFANSIVM